LRVEQLGDGRWQASYRDLPEFLEIADSKEGAIRALQNAVNKETSIIYLELMVVRRNKMVNAAAVLQDRYNRLIRATRKENLRLP
jgi:hypothetical protein